MKAHPTLGSMSVPISEITRAMFFSLLEYFSASHPFAGRYS